MEFCVSLAGVRVGVRCRYDEVRELCRDYLCDGEPAFVVSVDEADVAFEREKSVREALHEGLPVVAYGEPYLETLAVYRKVAVGMLEHGVFLMHGAAVAVNGEAYLFCARSGTGKTTHARLWLEGVRGACVVNGDKPLVRVADGTVEVCGTPWAGKEGLNANRIVPLRAVCLLERGRENRIERVSLDEAYPRLLEQSYWPAEADAMARTMRLVREVGERVGLWRLACTMEPEAARVAYEAMRGRG